MANSIALAETYLPIIDAIYKADSKTAMLDAANSDIQVLGGNQVKLFKLSMSGFGNYSRNNGFPQGDVNGSWETLQMQYDRGTSLDVDVIDNEETIGQAFGRLVGEFGRTQMIPELDATRFSQYAGEAITAGNVASGDITVGTTDVADLIDAADEAMQNDEVPEGSILYISPKAYRGLKAKITRFLANENNVQREVEMYNTHPVVVVPQGRFNTAITLKTGESDFGFVPTAGGYKINFMLIHPSAVRQFVKHNPLRIFTPENNIKKDAWSFQPRLYHGVWVLDNKVDGIYVHRAATANV